jgi:RNA polymerase sigma factor for flagellar operon FliA
VEEEKRKYRAIHGQDPTGEQLRERVGLSEENFKKKDYQKPIAEKLSLSTELKNSKKGSERKMDYEDTSATQPFQDPQKREIIAHITKGMSRAERLIVMLYYYDNMSMKEIGKVLDLSESRVSQMHTSLIERLSATAKIKNLEVELT